MTLDDILGRLFWRKGRISSDPRRLSSLLRRERKRFPMAELASISHHLQASALADPTGAESRLGTIVDQFRGQPTELLDRVHTQVLDSIVRQPLPLDSRASKIDDRLRVFEDRFGSNRYSAQLFRGALRLQQGSRSEAFGHYAKAAELAGPHGLPRMYVGAHSVRTGANRDWQAFEGSALGGISNAIGWERRVVSSAPLCIVVGVDSAYFQRFAAFFAGSLAAHDSTSRLHFHVVNWDAACARILNGLPGLDRISVSSEPYIHTSDRTYFATVRFLRAGEIMKEVDTPLFITDVDNRFTGSPARISRHLAQHDAGFRDTEMSRWFPWWAPTGSNVYINATDGGQRLAGWLTRYIAAKFVPNDPLSWWFDQLALNEVQQVARTQGLHLADMGRHPFNVTNRRPEEDISQLKWIR